MSFGINSPRRLAGAVLAFVVLLGSVAVDGNSASLPAAAARRHTRLTKSVPAKDDSVAAPKALQLWFSEKLELPLFKVTLSDAAGTVVAVGAPAYEGEAAPTAAIALAVKAPLTAGKYTVNWAVAGADGHPTKGSYDFVVKAGR